MYKNPKVAAFGFFVRFDEKIFFENLLTNEEKCGIIKGWGFCARPLTSESAGIPILNPHMEIFCSI